MVENKNTDDEMKTAVEDMMEEVIHILIGWLNRLYSQIYNL